MRQPGRRDYVQQVHLLLRVRFGFPKVPIRAEPGVVDQQAQISSVSDAQGNRFEHLGMGQICDQCQDSPPVGSTQFASERLQAIITPRD